MNQNGGKITWILDADVAPYILKMQQAETKAKATAKNVDDSLKQAGTEARKTLDGLATGFEQAGHRMSLYISAPIGVGFAKAVKSASEFESSMSLLTYTTGATGNEIGKLSAKARELGRDNTLAGVTASNAAQSMVELSKAGLDMNDTLDASRGVLSLAKAGQMDFGAAANITASALNAFGLEGKEAGKVADVLANGANKSQASLHDLGLGLQASASVASLFGISLEDNITALSIFANNGIRASDAGTSLKTMLLRLATPSKEAAGMMEEIGFSAYDAQGNFVGLGEMSNRLAKSLQGMTEEQRQATLGTIFGSDAIRAAALLSENAGEKYDKMNDAIRRTGTAQEMAKAMMGPYQKALEGLSNVISDAAIEIGGILMPKLIELYDALREGVTWFNGLSDGQQKLIVTFGLLLASIGPALVAFSLAVRAVSTSILIWQSAATAINAVRAAMIGLTLASKGAQVANGGVAGLFNKIGLAAVTASGAVKDGLVKSVAGISAAIAPHLKSVVAVFSVAARGIGAAIFSIPVVGWILLAVTALVGLFTYFYSTSEGFRNFVNGIFSGIGDMITAAFSGVGDFFSGLWSGIKEGVSSIGTFIQGVFSSIGSFFTSVFTTIGSIISSFVNSVVTFFTPLANAISVVVGGIVTVFNDLLLPIIQLAGSIIVGLGQIFFTVFMAISQIVWTVVSTIAQIIGVILLGTALFVYNSVLLPMLNFFITIFTSIWTFIVTVVTTIANVIATGFNMVVTFVSAALSAVWNVVVSIWNAIWGFISPIISTIVGFIVERFNNLVSNVSAVLDVIWSVVSSVWNTIWGFIGPIVSTIVNFVVERFNNLVNNVRNIFNMIRDAISNAINSAVNIVRSTVGQIADAVRNAVNNAYNAARDFVGRFSQAGMDMMRGLVNGIASNAGAVVAKVKEIAAGALNAVKSFFGIKSPSRVMMKMGQYITQGLGNGIESNARVAVKAAEKASSAVLSAFGGGASNYTIGVEEGARVAPAGAMDYNTSSDSSGKTENIYNITLPNVRDADDFAREFKLATEGR